MGHKLILNEELPPDLRSALTEHAETDNISMNDAATAVLAAHFNVGWEPSASKFRIAPERFKLRVPEELHRRIRIEAARDLLTIRGVTLSVLSEHYQTESIDPRRRPRKETV